MILEVGVYQSNVIQLKLVSQSLKLVSKIDCELLCSYGMLKSPEL